MKKLATLTHIVKETLEQYPETQGDDGKLVLAVFERIGIPTYHTLEYLADCGYISVICSIVRCRRKIQQEHAELCNEASEARRLQKSSVYRAYARSYLSEILAQKGEEK